MNETILTMLQSIIILAVALLTVYAVKWLTAKTKQAQNAVENETAKRYIGEASTAITDAVLATSQTYVDALKQSGTFTLENQREALSKAVASAKAQLTQGASEFLETAYGDVNKFLTEKIEAEVKSLSNGVAVLEGIPAD